MTGKNEPPIGPGATPDLDDNHGPIEGERDIPSVNRRGSSPVSDTFKKAGMVAVVALCGLGLCWMYLPQLQHKKGIATGVVEPIPPTDSNNPGEDRGGLTPTELKAQIDAELASRQKRPPAPIVGPIPLSKLNASPPPPGTAQGAAAERPRAKTREEQEAERKAKAEADLLERRQRSPLLALGTKGSREDDAPKADARAAAAPVIMTPSTTVTPEKPAASSSDLGGKLPPTEVSKVSAKVLANRDLMMTQGTFIDCTLETAIDSTVPGFTRCVTTRHVYSNSGRVILFERGTKLIGQYTGGLSHGQARIFVMWTRAETPNGVVINLNSPGVDSLGASGLDGHVDTHFWDRFGGALLLSMIQDVFDVIKSDVGGRAIDSTGNTQQATKDAASIALENSINIPPTLYKNQGDKINVITARDLDFSTVYSLSLAKGR
jgi:type IV secretion system protein VirB10